MLGVAMNHPIRLPILFCLLPAACAGPLLEEGLEEERAEPMVLDDDGSWCWFQEERALIVGGKLLVGSVSSGHLNPDRRGDINLLVHDVAQGTTLCVELHDRLELDDHDIPGLAAFSDGGVIAVYARHGTDYLVRVRTSQAVDGFEHWSDELEFEQRMDQGHGVTYSNVFLLEDEGDSSGRLYDFYRGDGWDPNAITSDDRGQTWSEPRRLLAGPGRPYVRYASNGRDRIDFVCTDQHPRDADNSIYHGFLRDGRIHNSSGEGIGKLGDEPVRTEGLTRLFQGDADNVAWVSDVVVDGVGRPHVVFSVQKDGGGVPRGKGGLDHRYHWARWDGQSWQQHELAFAGRRLYAGEDDYTGLIALDPADPTRVFLSTDADPATGEALVSASDGRRHYEIFEARTTDSGLSWSFRAITRDSSADNLRPIVPEPEGGQAFLLWLRGSYSTYTKFAQEVIALRLH